LNLSQWNLAEKGVLKNLDCQWIMVAVSSDGSRLACTHHGASEIVICETATGRILHRIASAELAEYPVMTFSTDGKLLAACGGGLHPGIHVWDIKSGEQRHRFAGHRGKILCLAFRPDGRRLASGSADSTVLIWELTGK